MQQTMWIIKRTGQLFANRKEIKDFVGQYAFKKMLKTGEIYYISPEMLDKLNEFDVLKNGTLTKQ